MGSVEVEDVEGVEGVAGARAVSRWAVMGCGRGLGSADGAERTKIRTATANKSTNKESCGKLEASEGCSSIARVHYSCAAPQAARSRYTSQDPYGNICNFFDGRSVYSARTVERLKVHNSSSSSLLGIEFQVNIR